MLTEQLELSEHKQKVARVYNLASAGYDKPALDFFPRTAVRLAQLARWHDALPTAYHALVVGSLAASLALLAKRMGVWQKVIGIACLNTLLLALAVAPLVGDVLQGPVKRAALFAKTRPEPGVLWNFNMPSFSVYRQQVSPTVQASSGEIALTRIDRLPHDRPTEMLFQEGGVVLVKVH